MKTIKIEKKEYQLEYTFEAAECRDLIQKMFYVLSGAYILKHTKMTETGEAVDIEKESTVAAMVDGASEMVAEIPHICPIAFYAGLLEHNQVSEDEAKKLMKAYMKENKLSFSALYEELKSYMEEDGFFELSGLTDMLKKMNKTEAENKTEQTKTMSKKSITIK